MDGDQNETSATVEWLPLSVGFAGDLTMHWRPTHTVTNVLLLWHVWTTRQNRNWRLASDTLEPCNEKML